MLDLALFTRLDLQLSKTARLSVLARLLKSVETLQVAMLHSDPAMVQSSSSTVICDTLSQAKSQSEPSLETSCPPSYHAEASFSEQSLNSSTVYTFTTTTSGVGSSSFGSGLLDEKPRSWLSTASSIISRIWNRGSSLGPGIPPAPVADVSAQLEVTCPIDDTHVRTFKSEKGPTILYVGQEDQVRPPSEILQRWESKDRERLGTDLADVAANICRIGAQRGRRQKNLLQPAEHGVFLDLRMSGYARRGDQQVTLVPCIWIICRTQWACDLIRSEMDSIMWPTLPVEIIKDKGAPRLCSSESAINADLLDLTDGISIGQDATLYINVEAGSALQSPLGLLCCATLKRGDKLTHKLSRIGGLVSVNGTSSPLGVTTAHGMLNNLPWHARVTGAGLAEYVDGYPDLGSQESDSEYNVGDEGDDDSTEDYSDHDEGVGYLGFRDPSLVSKWKSAASGGISSFLGNTLSLKTDLPNIKACNARSTDHTLLDMSKFDTTFHQSPGLLRKSSATQQHPTSFETDDRMSEGPVTINLGNRNIAKGQLVSGTTCLSVRGEMFTLRKIMTAAPLAQGTSGSWVTRGDLLCGMIVASSGAEPFALMITAERLFENIKSSDSSITNIEPWQARGVNILPSESDRPPAKKPSKIPNPPLTGPSSKPVITQYRFPSLGAALALCGTYITIWGSYSYFISSRIQSRYWTGHELDGALALPALPKLYGADWGYYPDAGTRLMTWVLPVLLLLSNIQLSPVSKWRFMTMMHVIGDPVDSLWSLVDKLYLWHRLREIAASISPAPGLSGSKGSDNGPMLSLEGRISVITAVLAGFEEVLGDNIQTEDDYREICRRFGNIGESTEERAKFAKWQRAALELTEARTDEWLRSALAVALYLLQLVSVVTGEVGADITSRVGRPGSIAIAMLLSWLLPLVLLSNSIGTFPSRRTCKRIIKRVIGIHRGPSLDINSRDYLRAESRGESNYNNPATPAVDMRQDFLDTIGWFGSSSAYQPWKVPETDNDTRWRESTTAVMIRVVGFLPIVAGVIASSFLSGASTFSIRIIWIQSVLVVWIISAVTTKTFTPTRLARCGGQWRQTILFVKDCVAAMTVFAFWKLPCDHSLHRINTGEVYSGFGGSGLYPVVFGACIATQILFYIIIINWLGRGLKAVRWTEAQKRSAWEWRWKDTSTIMYHLHTLGGGNTTEENRK